MNNTRPSFYLISSAVDGNVNAIEKILALYDPYISKCCLRPFYDKSVSYTHLTLPTILRV